MEAKPILVVDDDPGILAAVSDALSGEGFAVETALNGAAALEKVDRVKPGLILLDMRMPVMDGWAFARTLRARGLAIPILVMTAAANAAGWAREIQADGFLAKPFDVSDLLDAVVRLHAD